MGSLDVILRKLDERELARNIGNRHDEARTSFLLAKNTVDNWEEFLVIMGNYGSWHLSRVGLGSFPHWECESKVVDIIEHGSEFGGKTIGQVYLDAHHGTNGGLRYILDLVADHFKGAETEDYIRGVFLQNVNPTSWLDKVEIVRQFIARCGRDLSSYMDVTKPEAYASDYRELIRSYARAISHASSRIRK